MKKSQSQSFSPLNNQEIGNSKYIWIMLLFLFTNALINNIDKAVIGFASVPIMKELHLTPTQWGIVGSSFYWLFAISSLVIGGMADRKSSKKIISWMSFVWAGVQFATLFVIGLPSLILTRIILGVGEGPGSAVGAVVIGKWLPKNKYALGFACIFIGTALGPAIGSPILMSLIESHGWKSAFLATGIIGVLWTVLWLLFAKESPQDIGLQSPDSHISKSTKVTSTWREFLKEVSFKNFLFIILAGMAAYWLLALKLVWFPNYFQNVRHLSGSQLNLAVSLPFIFSAVAQVVVALLSDRFYRKTADIRKSRVIIAGSLMVLSSFGIYLATVVSSNLLSMLLFSIAPGLTTVSLILLPAILIETASQKNIGKAQGVFAAFSTVSSMIAPIVFGAIIERSSNENIGFNHAFQVSSFIILVIGILFWIGVNPMRQKKIEIQAEEKTV
ncbi:MFS transporter [Gottfriedia sp. NPDC057991]|uniref:MFS transporter n=1 Tax=Gottfriedia sp. NPDC057991 TaxID=3346298 RepID=UPI0036DD05B1